MQNNIKINTNESIYEKNKDKAYKPVDLTIAYMLLCMDAKPQPKLLKSIDMDILQSADELHDQILADGLEHVRIQIGETKGKLVEVLNEDLDRMMAFYLIVTRTTRGYHTEDLLKMYGFSSREELINTLSEFYTNTKEPRLVFKKFTSIREMVRLIIG